MSGYYYTIPADIFYDDKLSPLAKLLAAMIANFCDRYGTCTVTNKHMGKVLNRSERSLSRLVSELEEAGYIHVKLDILDNSKRFITLSEKMRVVPTTKMSTPHDKNDVPPRQKCLHNNTIYNNTKNNIVGEVLDYLNLATGSTFKSTTGQTQKFISGRQSEGYNLEDFKQVIDTMVAKWKGTEWEQYLRPTTLFSPSNFEKYLNLAKKPVEQKPKIKA